LALTTTAGIHITIAIGEFLKELTKRILTALLGAPVLLLLIWLGDVWLLGFVILLSVLAHREFNQFYKAKEIDHSQAWVLPYIIILPLVAWYTKSDFLIVFGATTLIWLMVLLIRELFSTRNEVFSAVGAAFVTGFMIVLPFSGLLALSEILGTGTGARLYLIIIVVCTWATDTFAYFGGVTFGKHKLFPRVSPKKTIEGFISGLLGSMFIAFIFSLLSAELQFSQVLIPALVMGILGPLGDLMESRLKRDAKVKDSSNILPGHGGVLDRFDSWIFAIPLLFLLHRFIICTI
jgi:phosphatidate cytidylyltransferase